MWTIYWGGFMTGIISSVISILICWHVITPEMKKEVIEVLERRLTWLKEDTLKSHRRTY